MVSIMVAGAGRIGSSIAQLLSHCGDYQVILTDNHPDIFQHMTPSARLITETVDIKDTHQLTEIKNRYNIEAVVSCLPYYNHIILAEFAKAAGIHYFDLTEDIAVANHVRHIAQSLPKAFVSRCGAAPGFINIVANQLMSSFDTLDTVKLRACCLPKYVSNSLQYAIAWSIDGLINEYGNQCYGMVDGKEVPLEPLEDLETIELDGTIYEAFNTSGGIGALSELYAGKVLNLNYKTMRYPGHCDKMRFLMKDLHLNKDRETLKRILLRSLPETDHDTMIIYVSASGMKDAHFIEKNNVFKIFPQELFGQHWSAIRVATASSAAAVVDIILQDPKNYHGFVIQETISLDALLNNRFGKIFTKE